jgi:predicted ester cyclase
MDYKEVDTMSAVENKAIIRRLIEAWNTKGMQALDELIAPNYAWHFRGKTTRPESGPAWYKRFAASIRAEVPDFHIALEDLLADGDKVIWRYLMTGTHAGETRQSPWGTTIPPTGKAVAWTAICISCIVDGRITEEWLGDDEVLYWQQIGALPSPTSSQPTGAVWAAQGERLTSPEENKAIVRRYIEVWNTGQVGALDELVVPHHVEHWGSLVRQSESGPEWTGQIVTSTHTTYPDVHFAIDDLLADGDKVVLRGTVTGTHTGKEFTLWGITLAPTGKKMAWTFITIFRIADNRIVEDWWEEDDLTWWQQLGAIPSPTS